MMEMSTPETSRRQSVRNSEDRKRKDRDVLEKICISCIIIIIIIIIIINSLFKVGNLQVKVMYKIK